MSLVMDKGFFSQNNIDALFAVKDRFTIAVPTRVKWLQEFIDSLLNSISIHRQKEKPPRGPLGNRPPYRELFRTEASGYLGTE